MTATVQLFGIFAFGLVMAGVVFLGVVRAQEYEKRATRSRAAEREGDSRP